MELVNGDVKENRITLIRTVVVFLTEGFQHNLVIAGYDLAGNVDLHIDGFGIVAVKFRQSCAWNFDVPQQLCPVAIGN